MNKAEKSAVEILSRYSTAKAPVDISKIIKESGIKIKEENFGEEISGVLMIKNNVPTIGINKKEAHTRKRFSLAHEYGHYIMHYEADKVFVDNNSFKLMFRKQNFSQAEVRREREANSFAAAILMPRFLIKEEFEKLQENLSKHLNDEQIINELADTFKVSELAMAYRLSNLGYVNYR